MCAGVYVWCVCVWGVCGVCVCVRMVRRGASVYIYIYTWDIEIRIQQLINYFFMDKLWTLYEKCLRLSACGFQIVSHKFAIINDFFQGVFVFKIHFRIFAQIHFFK